MGYPSAEEELQMLQRSQSGPSAQTLSPCISLEEVQQLQQACLQVQVEKSLQQYMLNLVRATREDSQVRLGVSPRGAVILQRTAQAIAFLAGRTYVLPDDIKELAPSVLSHRIIPSGSGHPRNIVERLLKTVEIPA
jgi:MoxR-like ATPase